jgi:DNA-binding SARP family transcriptional activator/tetratricopeptide (TPR) repeat protein
VAVHAGEPVRVELLGAVCAWRGERELNVGARQQRAVLGVLATRANRPVSRSELIDSLWGDDPPPTAGSAVYSYIARLRRALEPGGQRRAPAGTLSSNKTGYVLRLAPDSVDADVFNQRLRRAHHLRAKAAMTEAVRQFDAALALWHGTPWADIGGPFAQAERVRLTEQYLTAVEDRAGILVAIGDPGAVVADLSGEVRINPFRERLAGLLMLALYRTGQQADALALYRDTRRLLVTELGVEPGPDLQRLHKQILTADPSLNAPKRTPATLSSAVGQALRDRPAPAELPHDIANFTGRGHELAQLKSLIAPEEGALTHRALVISAIDGIAGIGKTALAVHFAHRISIAFGDGQLFVNLRGFDPNQPPLHPSDALRHLLTSLGARSADIPSTLDGQTGLYRTLLAGRRVLIVLDNARTADQVRPLLPGSPTCAVIVTSRNRLEGLAVRDGACQLTIGLLNPPDGLALLAGTVGQQRVAAEPGAAEELVRSCGYLPLAIRIAAERILSRPYSAIADLAGELGDEKERLNALSAGDDQAAALRAAFQWSYHALTPDAASMFRLLGLLPWPEASTPAISALSGRVPGDARRLLQVLTKAHLLEQVDADRYRLHDLLHLYAGECAAEDPPQARRQAVRRILTWYLYTAEEAGHVLMPQRRRIPKEPMEEDCPFLSFSSHHEALRWCETERDHLVAATHHAAKMGEHGLAWRLPAVLWIFFSLGRYWHDWLVTSRVGLASARSIGDREGESQLLGSLGALNSDRRNLAEAIDCFRQALAICGELGDLHGQGMSQLGLGIAYHRQKQYEASIEHHRRALGILSETGDRWGGTVALGSLSAIHRGLGQTEKAIGYLREALARCREIGDRWFEATVLSRLAEAYLETQRFSDAIGHYNQALTIRCQIGDRRGQARTLTALGNAYSAARQFGDAIGHYKQALAINRDIDDQQAQARTLDALRAAQRSARSCSNYRC